MTRQTRRDHGDGGIDQRGPDRWRLRYRVDGERFSKTVKGSITDAKRELRALLKSADDGQHVEPNKTTLSVWSEKWLALLDRRAEEPAPKRKRGLVNAKRRNATPNSCASTPSRCSAPGGCNRSRRPR